MREPTSFVLASLLVREEIVNGRARRSYRPTPPGAGGAVSKASWA
jgi:hypothetical protein